MVYEMPVVVTRQERHFESPWVVFSAPTKEPKAESADRESPGRGVVAAPDEPTEDEGDHRPVPWHQSVGALRQRRDRRGRAAVSAGSGGSEIGGFNTNRRRHQNQCPGEGIGITLKGRPSPKETHPEIGEPAYGVYHGVKEGLLGALPMRKTHMLLRSGFGRNVITSLIIIQPDRCSRRSSANQH